LKKNGWGDPPAVAFAVAFGHASVAGLAKTSALSCTNAARSFNETISRTQTGMDKSN
jgi:hypothetical protein